MIALDKEIFNVLKFDIWQGLINNHIDQLQKKLKSDMFRKFIDESENANSTDFDPLKKLNDLNQANSNE